MFVIFAIACISGHISNVRKTDGKFFAIILAVFATFPKLSFPHNVDKICQVCRFRCWCISVHKCLWAQNLATLEQIFYLVCLFTFKFATLYKYRKKKKRKKIEINNA